MSNLKTALTDPQQAIQTVKDALTKEFDYRYQIDWGFDYQTRRQTWEDPAEYETQEMESNLLFNNAEVELKFDKGRPTFEFALNFDLEDAPGDYARRNDEDGDFDEQFYKVLDGIMTDLKGTFRHLKLVSVDRDWNFDKDTCVVFGTLLGEPGQLKPPQSARAIRQDAGDNIGKDLRQHIAKVMQQTARGWMDFGLTLNRNMSQTPRPTFMDVIVSEPRVSLEGNTRSGDQYFEIRGHLEFKPTHKGKGGGVLDEGVRGHYGMGGYDDDQLNKWVAGAKKAALQAVKSYPRGTILKFDFLPQYFLCQFVIRVDPEMNEYQTVRPSEFRLASDKAWKA